MEIIINRYFASLKGETYNLIWLTVFIFIWLHSSANVAAGSLSGVGREKVQNISNLVILLVIFLPVSLVLSFKVDGLLGIWIGASIAQFIRLLIITFYLYTFSAFETKLIEVVEIKEAEETKGALLNVFNMHLSSEDYGSEGSWQVTPRES